MTSKSLPPEPGHPTEMPRAVRTARGLTFAAAGVVLLVGLMYVALSMTDQEELERDFEGVSAATFGVIGVLLLVHGGLGVLLATRYGRGGGRTRAGALVWAAIAAVVGLLTMPIGVLVLALAVLVVVMLGRGEGRAWFDRPRG